MEGAGTPTSTTAAESTANAPELAPAQFARNASGLIRSATLWDAFGINATNGLFVLGIAWILLYAGVLYPGGGVFFDIVMAVILSIPVTIVYLQLAIVFPRSGGDYVYNSRLLHPSIGFAANVGLTAGLIFWAAFGGVYVVAYGIAPGLITAGIQLNNDPMINAGTWFQGQAQVFILSVVIIILFGVFFVLGGNKAYFRFQIVAVILGGLALAVVVAYGFLASQHSALTNLDVLFKGMGASESATTMVKGESPPFSFHQSYLMVWWAAGYIMSAFYSAYIGGEVKTPGRTQMLGGLGALAWMAGWTALVVGAMFNLLGEPFFTNLGSAFDTSSFGPGLTPIYPTLIAGAIGNGYFTLVLMACFSVFIIAVVGANMLLATRCMFAWGIDRVVPAWLCRVAPSGSPTSATLVTVIGTVGFCAAYTYGWMTALGGSWMFLVVFLLLCVSAMILPYRQTTVWESSPNANRLLGVPTITWWGAFGFISVVICMSVLIVDPNYGISPRYNLFQFLLAPIFIAAGLIWYYVWRTIEARKGIDTDLNFSQIPPE